MVLYQKTFGRALTALPVRHGMPHAVVHPVPTPRAGTTGSRARHGRGERYTPCRRPPDRGRLCLGGAHLTGVDFALVATPLALHPDRRRAPLRDTVGIKGDDAVGLPSLLDHLSDQHRDQGTMIPGRGADEVLHDLALDLDQRRDVLGILALQEGEETRERAMHMTSAGLGLKRLLRGHDESAQTVHQGVNTLGDTVQSFNNASCRCAHGVEGRRPCCLSAVDFRPALPTPDK